MLFLIVLIVLFSISLIMFFKLDWEENFRLQIAGLIIFVISLVSLISIIFARFDKYAELEEIKAFETTVNDNRENESEIERAAILTKISEINQSIARAKYFNKTFIGDIFIPDEFCSIDYLK